MKSKTIQRPTVGVQIASVPPMTPEELRAIREALGLTVPALAALLGVRPESVDRWNIGLYKMPLATAILLRLLVDPQVGKAVRRRLDLPEPHVARS